MVLCCVCAHTHMSVMCNVRPALLIRADGCDLQYCCAPEVLTSVEGIVVLVVFCLAGLVVCHCKSSP